MKQVICFATFLSVFVVHTTCLASFGISRIQGKWIGAVNSAVLNLITPNGPIQMCMDTVPTECRDEIPPGTEEYVFKGENVSTLFTHLLGVTTEEQSRSAFPTCARLGYFPIESSLNLTDFQILSYEYKTGEFSFQDRITGISRCQSINYIVDKRGSAYLRVRHYVDFNGTPEELARDSIIHQCEPAMEQCLLEPGENDTFCFVLTDIFSLYCVEGDCLNDCM